MSRDEKIKYQVVIRLASDWGVPEDYFHPLYAHLVWGIDPGDFWRAVLAKDCYGVIQRSHPLNDMDALKFTVNWITSSWPSDAYGSYDRVAKWQSLSNRDRGETLDRHEMILMLKNPAAGDPNRYPTGLKGGGSLTRGRSPIDLDSWGL